MLPTEHFRRRRIELLSRVEGPVLLFAGGEVPRNFPANPYRYRADSNFLFFFARPEPGSAAFLDPADGSVTLFLPERTIASAVWTGDVPSLDQMGEATGVDRVLPVEDLAEHVRNLAGGRTISGLAVADPNACRTAAELTGRELDFREPDRLGPFELQDALADLRLHKNELEVAQMRAAAEVTREAFETAMATSRPGVGEQELAGLVAGCYAGHDGEAAFSTILSVRGEILHTHSHAGRLREGDLVLMDSGAEVPSGYACDVTRTWPADGRFTTEQRAVYEIVMEAEREAIDRVRAGARFRDIHVRAAEVVADGLVDLGLLRGDPADLVERGAHALFFPHGVGHFLGLDVHDLESFGDRVLYGKGRERSDQFGTKWLRIDRDLAPGMVVTIEPGIYFIPAILHDPDFRRGFDGVVDFARAERYLASDDGRGFGGIRIEDVVLVTETGPDVLTVAIPKEVEAIETRVGSAGSSNPARGSARVSATEPGTA